MIADGIRRELDTDHVVVLVNPLLIEMGTHRDCDVVVVVSATPETQVAPERRARHGRGRRARSPGGPAARSRSAPAHADVLLGQRGDARGARDRGRRCCGAVSRRREPIGARYHPRDAVPRRALRCRRDARASAPSFPELFAQVVAGPDTPRSPDDGRRGLTQPCSIGSARPRATTSCGPRARAIGSLLEGRVRARCSRSSALADDGRLRDELYETFTDPANYALFDDVLPAARRAGRPTGLVLGDRVELRGVARGSARRARGARPVPRARDQRARGRREAGRRGSSSSRWSGSALDAADAVYVGDNPEFDVVPATALGMTPVLIDRRERFPDTDGIRIADLRELPRPGGAAHDDGARLHRR